MSTYTFFELQTGANTGRMFTGPDDMLKANTPEGCIAMEGEHSPLSVWLNVPEMKLTQAPKPPATDMQDWAWNEESSSWVPVQTDAAIAAAVRAVRTKLLDDTRWVIDRAQEQGVAVPPEWLAYRQSLRDISKQSGFPRSVVWPTQPE